MKPVFDDDGFLIDFASWSRSIAIEIAEADGVVLSDEHWQVIGLIRQFYLEYDHSPAMRPLIKYLRSHTDSENINSIYLLQLFPDSPAKLAAKIAGLPKPENCL